MSSGRDHADVKGKHSWSKTSGFGGGAICLDRLVMSSGRDHADVKGKHSWSKTSGFGGGAICLDRLVMSPGGDHADAKGTHSWSKTSWWDHGKLAGWSSWSWKQGGDESSSHAGGEATVPVVETHKTARGYAAYGGDGRCLGQR